MIRVDRSAGRNYTSLQGCMDAIIDDPKLKEGYQVVVETTTKCTFINPPSRWLDRLFLQHLLP